MRACLPEQLINRSETQVSRHNIPPTPHMLYFRYCGLLFRKSERMSKRRDWWSGLEIDVCSLGMNRATSDAILGECFVMHSKPLMWCILIILASV